MTTMNEADMIFLHDLVLTGKGVLVDRESAESAKIALKFFHSDINGKLKLPHLEMHPDGEIAFTWRKQGIGILNIAFGVCGKATWAAYLEREIPQDGFDPLVVSAKSKGNFLVEDGIPHDVKKVIKEISDENL